MSGAQRIHDAALLTERALHHGVGEYGCEICFSFPLCQLLSHFCTLLVFCTHKSSLLCLCKLGPPALAGRLRKFKPYSVEQSV